MDWSIMDDWRNQPYDPYYAHCGKKDLNTAAEPLPPQAQYSPPAHPFFFPSNMPVQPTPPTDSLVKRVNPRELRNKAEKERRDKMTKSINHLATIVPPVVATGRKLDKTSVLKLSAHYLRAHQYACSSTLLEVCLLLPRLLLPLPTTTPSTYSTFLLAVLRRASLHLAGEHPQLVFQDIRNSESLFVVFGESIDNYTSQQFSPTSALALLGLLKGFLLSVTYKGIVVVASHNVKQYLGYTELDLIGQNMFNFIHKDDHQVLREQLKPQSYMFGTNGEIVIPDDQETKKTLAQVLSADKRRFIVRFKKLGQRSEPTQYVTCCVEGTFRKSDKAGLNNNRCCQMVRRARVKGDNTCSSGNDVVFIGLVRPTSDTFLTEKKLEAFRMEYRTRHSIDGEIIECEPRIALVTGYMTHEVNGVNAMNFMHRDDVRWVIVALREMYDQLRLIGESCYRLMTKSGKFIYMQTKGYLDVDHDSRAVTSFVCTNTVVEEEDGKQLIKLMKERFILMINNNETPLSSADIEINDAEESNDSQLVAVEDPRQLEKVILHLVTNLPSSQPDKSSLSPTAVDRSSPHRLAIIPPRKERIVHAIKKIYGIINTFQKPAKMSANEGRPNDDVDDDVDFQPEVFVPPTSASDTASSQSTDTQIFSDFTIDDILENTGYTAYINDISYPIETYSQSNVVTSSSMFENSEGAESLSDPYFQCNIPAMTYQPSYEATTLTNDSPVAFTIIERQGYANRQPQYQAGPSQASMQPPPAYYYRPYRNDENFYSSYPNMNASTVHIPTLNIDGNRVAPDTIFEDFDMLFPSTAHPRIYKRYASYNARNYNNNVTQYMNTIPSTSTAITSTVSTSTASTSTASTSTASASTASTSTAAIRRTNENISSSTSKVDQSNQTTSDVDTMNVESQPSTSGLKRRKESSNADRAAKKNKKRDDAERSEYLSTMMERDISLDAQNLNYSNVEHFMDPNFPNMQTLTECERIALSELDDASSRDSSGNSTCSSDFTPCTPSTTSSDWSSSLD